MSVELFPSPELSVRQILAGSLNDPDIDDIKAVIVASLADDGTVIINYSGMDVAQMALLARHVQIETDRVLLAP